MDLARALHEAQLEALRLHRPVPARSWGEGGRRQRGGQAPRPRPGRRGGAGAVFPHERGRCRGSVADPGYVDLLAEALCRAIVDHGRVDCSMGPGLRADVVALPPVFSVVIPTYDRPELLAEAVRSVLDQTVTGLEVLVVDDHGARPVEPFDDPRVRVLRAARQPGARGRPQRRDRRGARTVPRLPRRRRPLDAGPARSRPRRAAPGAGGRLLDPSPRPAGGQPPDRSRVGWATSCSTARRRASARRRCGDRSRPGSTSGGWRSRTSSGGGGSPSSNRSARFRRSATWCVSTTVPGGATRSSNGSPRTWRCLRRGGGRSSAPIARRRRTAGCGSGCWPPRRGTTGPRSAAFARVARLAPEPSSLRPGRSGLRTGRARTARTTRSGRP